MENRCQTYSLEELSRFVDNELESKRCHDIEQHLENCPVCRHTVDQCRRLSAGAVGAISQSVDRFDTGRLRQTVLEQVTSSDSGTLKKLFDYFSSKLYLKIASIAVIMVIGFAFYLGKPINVQGPSAIVTSVDANMSSVMIFETQNKKHTVIWFSET